MGLAGAWEAPPAISKSRAATTPSCSIRLPRGAASRGGEEPGTGNGGDGADQKWKSTGTSTQTATGLLLLSAGLKTHFITASLAAPSR